MPTHRVKVFGVRFTVKVHPATYLMIGSWLLVLIGYHQGGEGHPDIWWWLLPGPAAAAATFYRAAMASKRLERRKKRWNKDFERIRKADL